MEGAKSNGDSFICKEGGNWTGTSAIRLLAYGIAGDLVDEYVRLSVPTCLDLMYRFYSAVVVVFGEEYL
jgi:hypothetical protein